MKRGRFTEQQIIAVLWEQEAGAPRPDLLPPTTQKAQINPGLSFRLDEKRGSRQTQWNHHVADHPAGDADGGPPSR
jgi:hypothetical protein